VKTLAAEQLLKRFGNKAAVNGLSLRLLTVCEHLIFVAKSCRLQGGWLDGAVARFAVAERG